MPSGGGWGFGNCGRDIRSCGQSLREIMSGASLAMGLDSGMVDRSSRMGGGFWVGQVTGLPPAVEGRVGGLMPWAGCSQAGFGCTSRQGVTFWSHILAGMEMRNLQRWD